MPRLVALAASLLLMVTGATLAGCGAKPLDPVPLVPFGDFEVGRSGGVAGVQEVLYVRADGAAVLVSGKPAAGRFDEPTLGRLRMLLESGDFRREAATAAQDDAPPRCTDMFSTSVRMGKLRMSVEESCGNEKRPATPIFDEILTLTSAAREGQFSAPVGGEEPRLVGLRLQRPRSADQAEYTITVAADGEAILASEGDVRRRESLSTADRDVLRMLTDRLVQTPVTDCRSTVQYRLTITGFPKASGPDCGYRDHYQEFRAVVAHLQTVVR